MEQIKPSASVDFTEPEGVPTIVEVIQTHKQEVRGGNPRILTAKMSIEPDCENIVLLLETTNGIKSAHSRLTLTVGEVRQLSGYLLKAIEFVEEYSRYAEEQSAERKQP